MLACGRNSSAVLSPDGTLYTTGSNRLGQIGHGMATNKWVFEAPIQEDNLRFVFVDVFNTHMAAVDVDGHVHVSGTAFYGQLGLGQQEAKVGFYFLQHRRVSDMRSHIRRFTKVGSHRLLGVSIAPFANERVLTVACGEHHTLALSASGRVWSTGLNFAGQLGLGDFETRYRFTDVDTINFVAGREEGRNVISVVAGETHSMMLCQNGLLFACGKNNEGVLGVGDTVDRNTPTLVEELSDRNVSSIAAGVYHNLAITDEGRLYSWGIGWYGQLGQGNSRNILLPKEVWLSETADDFVLMASGGIQHTTILTRDKTVWSCGRGCHGVLATGDIGCRLVPVRIDMRVFKETSPDNHVITVVAGHHHTGFVASDGTMYMCGRGDGGNIWFKAEEGPGGLSLPRQTFPRVKPVLVRMVKGLELKAPVLVGPALAWQKRLSTLVLAFCVPILKTGQPEYTRSTRSRRKSPRTQKRISLPNPFVYDLQCELLAMIAKMVLTSPLPEHAHYHKSVRMLMGSEN